MAPDETTDCHECGDSVDPDTAVTEVNKFGPGPDERVFCDFECSLKYAGVSE